MGYIRSKDIVRGETPTGAIDGVNTQFILAGSPVAGTLEVYVNGLFQAVDVDYTILDKIITLAVPPETGDLVLVGYLKKG